MKKSIIILILLVSVVSLFAETKISMKIWNRYTLAMEDGDLTENGIAVKRGYLRLEPNFGGGIKGRFNLDFFSDDDANDGAGIKLKYAYIDYKKMPIEDSKISVGLTKNYFGTIYSWSYPTIEKDPADKYGYISSTDYGLAFSGNLPKGYGEYAVGIYNGEGYKKTGGDLNTSMAFLGNVRVIPIPGLMMGGSVYSTEYDMGNDKTDFMAIAGLTKLSYQKFSILAEYLTKEDDEITSSAIMIMPKVVVTNCLDLIGRYDMVDYDTDNDDVYGGKVKNSDNSSFLAGFNWHIKKTKKQKPVLTLQANFMNTAFDAEETATGEEIYDEQTFKVQLKWKFSHKID